MGNPNYCPNCGHDLQQYKDGQEESDASHSEERLPAEELTREDYKEIFHEELEKAKKDSEKEKDDKPYAGKSGEEMTREDYEQIFEDKLEEVREEKEDEDNGEVDVDDIDPELKEALTTIMEADEETIEHMQEGLSKQAVLDVRDIADGKTDNLRIF